MQVSSAEMKKYNFKNKVAWGHNIIIVVVHV